MDGGSLTVLHTSDYQCGKPFLPEAADAMVRLAEDVRPDVVVASGDLTQRAKSREFGLARSILDRFGDVPIVVTPGNHDVPLYRVWERAAAPFRNWRRFSGPELDTVTRVDGATFVALCSAAPRRAIVNGRIDDEQIAFARRAFGSGPPGDIRVLVIHHHFAPPPDGLGGRPLPRASWLATKFEEMGADAVLGGHIHQLQLRTTAEVRGRAAGEDDVNGVPMITSGSTTSGRGRGSEEGWNSLCVVRFEEREVRVTPYTRRSDGDRFEPREGRVFRRGHAASAEERVG